MWHILEKDGFVWITNGKNKIKISRDKKKYGYRFAQREMDRRNKDPNIENFEFPENEIYKIVNFYVNKTLFFCKNRGIRLSLEEIQSDCYFEFAKAIKSFIPGDVQFISYMSVCWRRMISNYLRKLKKKSFKPKNITEKMIKKSLFNSLRSFNFPVETKLDSSIFRNCTDRKKDIIKDYAENNMTMHEIAMKFGITRQAVHLTIQKFFNKIKMNLSFYRLTNPFIDSIIGNRLEKRVSQAGSVSIDNDKGVFND